MPVTIGGTVRLGFGLWNSIPATIAVDVLMFAIGVVLYFKTTKPADRTGKVALWSLEGFLPVA